MPDPSAEKHRRVSRRRIVGQNAELNALRVQDRAPGSATSPRSTGTVAGAVKPRQTLLPFTSRIATSIFESITTVSPGLRLSTNMQNALALISQSAPLPEFVAADHYIPGT
jgi:hypothetical protein